ncbi:hypothetical protein AMS68_002166 [Peltaster fructicola]|uniref:DNA polymerase alpha/delta/epsilon subunit B domain-containing protein n=1 Tax=Peltaster fructicola TaxID=286661 RepID=A0A6H0XPV0_9PEZI|nr:hypothetical protein AMS68_002166 [Peltaster fructicola]
MDLPLKPNVLEDIGKEHWIAAPPPRERYKHHSGEDSVMLEDESGRLQLTGSMLGTETLVTGAIVAVIGTENRDGDFEVLEIRVPDLPRQPQRWEAQDSEAALAGSPLTPERKSGGKVAIVSGLDISRDAGDTLTLDLLMEYLLGEAAGADDQEQSTQITRLIIAGNSLTHASPIPPREDTTFSSKNKQKKYGYDSATYNSAPTDILDSWIATLLATMPVTILPGDSDPTATSLPQPALHMAFFPMSRAYTELADSDEANWFDSTTNPAEFHVAGHRILATGGQPVEDVFRYLDSNSRVEMMESMLRWRLVAPTAPDTLWCYPFQDKDKFVLSECPHVFIAGNQPQFETAEIDGPVGQLVRLIAVPRYKQTGEIVLMDEETLECEILKIGLFEDEDDATG